MPRQLTASLAVRELRPPPILGTLDLTIEAMRTVLVLEQNDVSQVSR
jgi:hypothetical protein